MSNHLYTWCADERREKPLHAQQSSLGHIPLLKVLSPNNNIYLWWSADVQETGGLEGLFVRKRRQLFPHKLPVVDRSAVLVL